MRKCKICNNEKQYKQISPHLNKIHNISAKDYYDQYIKDKDEGVCKFCKKETTFVSINQGYKLTCKGKCSAKLTKERNQEKYGVDNVFQLESVKEKSKKTIQDKYGVDNVSKLESVKKKKSKTTLKNFGVENPFDSEEIRLKAKKTIQDKYGVDNVFRLKKFQDIAKKNMIKKYGVKKALQSNKIKQKQEQTMLERYGVKNAMDLPEFVKKAQENGGGRAIPEKIITKFGNEIIVQGKLEKEFVQLCNQNNIKVLDGPCIPYKFENKKHKYYSDFLIIRSGKKQIVEIKSSYYYEKYKDQVLAKKLAAESYSSKNNYLPYILMIDKIYLP